MRAPGAAGRDGVLHPTKVTTTRALAPAASDVPRCGVRVALRHRHHRMTGCRRPRQQDFPSPPASDADSSLTGFRPLDCPLRLRVDDDRDWIDAWGTQQSCSASRHATLVSHLYANREPAPEFLEQSLRRSPGPALRSDQRSRRLTDRLQLLSWNVDLHEVRIRACWPRTSMGRGMWSTYRRVLASSPTVPWRRTST